MDDAYFPLLWQVGQSRNRSPQRNDGFNPSFSILGEREVMQSVMLQFKHQGSAPSLDEVRRLFNLKVDEIDPQFGVIATDPDKSIYTVLVASKASERVRAVLATRPRDPAEGIFANPRIEPFGQPEE
jgi:hypothetical protein